MGVPGRLECALDGCLVWASAPAACHLWVSFQVTPPKRAAAFTAVPQSLRLLLTRTRHALQHILTLFFFVGRVRGGWCLLLFLCVFFFLFCYPTLAHCNTKIGHFSALGVFHPHCCRSSNLKCDSQVASALTSKETGDTNAHFRRPIFSVVALAVSFTQTCNVSKHTHTHIHPGPLLVNCATTRMLSPVG